MHTHSHEHTHALSHFSPLLSYVPAAEQHHEWKQWGQFLLLIRVVRRGEVKTRHTGSREERKRRRGKQKTEERSELSPERSSILSLSQTTRLWASFLLLTQSSSSLTASMSLKEKSTAESAGTHLWLLLGSLLCSAVLAGGPTTITKDLKSTAATTLPEDWVSTTVQLQPDLETEAQTQTKASTEGPTDAPTAAPTESQTEMQTQIITSNYTGWSVHQSSLSLSSVYGASVGAL